MNKQIGAILARTFRDICEDANKRARREYNVISMEEMKEIEQLLKQIDNPKFSLQKELIQFFKLELEDTGD